MNERRFLEKVESLLNHAVEGDDWALNEAYQLVLEKLKHVEELEDIES